jgi:predicted nucleic acid-binding protein
MGWLRDTNVLSAFAPGKPAIAADVITWFGDRNEALYLSSITAGRIEAGICKARSTGSARFRSIAARIVKTTGDRLSAEFASVIDAVRCAVELQRAMALRNHGAAEHRIQFRIGIISATSSSKMARFPATASTSRRGSKDWPNRAGSASAGSCATGCATNSSSALRISASSRSRRLRGRSAPTASHWPRRRPKAPRHSCRAVYSVTPEPTAYCR